MRASLEFLLGLLEGDEPICVAQDDFDGAHGQAVRAWQRMGFVSAQPAHAPGAACPHCAGGVPYRLAGRLLCPRCHSRVDPRHLSLWPLDREAFLRWLALRLRLQGGVRRVDERLWQLGTWRAGDEFLECFYRRGGPLSDLGRMRLAAYRNVLVLSGLFPPPEADRLGGRYVSLLELLRVEGGLAVTDLRPLLRPRGKVRFDAQSGALWVGDAPLGEVPVGSKEFFFLRCLASHLDQFVAYADLKYFVLLHAGSSDSTEEATFCQGLKSRIKKRWIPQIDRLIATTNKADGYRLRGHAEPRQGLWTPEAYKD